MATLAEVQAEIQAYINQIIPKADFPAEKMNPLMQLITSILFMGKKYEAITMVNADTTQLAADTGFVNLSGAVVNYTLKLPANPQQFQTVQVFTSTTGSVSTALAITAADDTAVYSDVSTNLDTLLFIYNGTAWVLQGFSRFVA